MKEQIRVHVVNYGRPCLYMRYRDPVTGKQVARTTGTAKQKEAEREAAKWEAELRDGRYKSPSRVTWVEFRHRYEDEVLPGLADRTATKVAGTFNAIERVVNPQKLSALTAERISYLQSEMRKPRTIPAVTGDDGNVIRPARTIPGLTESTIKGHMAHLLSALNWAKRMNMLHEVPSITMPQRAKQSKVMKGRPITGEEFERMLAAVPRVLLSDDRQNVPESDWTAEEAALVDSWRHFLRGLWCSGLRLEESLYLTWDAMDKPSVDLTGRYPMMRIPAESEKGNRDRLLPIAPEFAEFLQSVPEADRTGFVFNPLARRDRSRRPAMHNASKITTQIGTAAGVKVNTSSAGKVKYASAHDLRRSFGERWSRRVMPAVLQELMRHESIETTMLFYVGRNAENTAAVLWAAAGISAGNTDPERETACIEESTQAVVSEAS